MSLFCHRCPLRTNGAGARARALLVAASLLPSVAWARKPHPALVTALRVSSPTWIAHRTGRPGCWVTFRLSTPAPSESALCIPQALWVHEYSATGTWSGSWRASSPLELRPGGKKKVLYFFHAAKLDAAPRIRHSWLRAFESRREALSRWLRFSGSDPSGLFRHLLLGENAPSLLPLRILGFVHLLTASGIQLLALAAWIGFLLGLALRLFRLRAQPLLHLKSILTGAIWFWSWILAGARGTMLRPLLLLGLRAGGRKAGLRWNRAWLLALAAFADLSIGLCLCLLRQRSARAELLDPGRIFYFFAAGAVLLVLERPRTGARALSYARITLEIWLVISLILLFSERFICLLTPALILITLPLLAGVVYPLLILRSLLPQSATYLAAEIAHVLALAQRLLAGLARIAFSVHSLWWVPRWAWLAAVFVAALLWFFPERHRPRLGACFALILVFAGFVPPDRLALAGKSGRSDRASSVEQIDVGQGDGALVRAGSGAGDAGLIDSGSAHALTELQWLELLLGHGITRIDWMAATHLDEDHAGGVLTLSDIAQLGCATTSAAELDSARGRKWREELEARGVKVTSRLGDCVPFPALGPPARTGRGSRAHAANENMSAFLVPLQSGGFYLSAGDATAPEEPRIGAWAAAQARDFAPGPRILKLSHHGSRTSSNPVFLRQIAPTEAWISVGVGNSYGHPSPIVLERVRGMGIPILRTDEDGTLTTAGARHRR